TARHSESRCGRDRTGTRLTP
ncbi:hypothetical protein STRIP9103_04611, partial [Streptomyces ipomoeae 91-03]